MFPLVVRPRKRAREKSELTFTIPSRAVTWINVVGRSRRRRNSTAPLEIAIKFELFYLDNNFRLSEIEIWLFIIKERLAFCCNFAGDCGKNVCSVEAKYCVTSPVRKTTDR